MYVRAADRQHVLDKQRSVVLEIHRPIGVLILETRDGVRRRRHMQAVASDYQVVVVADGLLPSDAPIWRDVSDVLVKAATGSGLRASDVVRPVDRTGKVQMVVPHDIAANSCSVLRESSLNERTSTRSRRGVAGDPGVSPCRSAIPEVLYGRIVV